MSMTLKPDSKIKSKIMEELIKIEKSPTTGDPIVNARNLHKGLEVKMNFSHWIRPLIEKWGFIENQDYACYFYDVYGNLLNNMRQAKKSQPDTQGIRIQKIEYVLTLNCAKEIAMVQNNAKGKEIRQFFIEAEKELQKLKFASLQQPKTIMLQVRNISIAEAAKSLGSCSHQVNQVLRKNRYFKPNNKPYDKWFNQGYFIYEAYNPQYSAKRLMLTSTKGMPLVQELLGKTTCLPEVVRQVLPVQQQESLLPAVVSEWITRMSEQEIAFNAMINHMLMCKSGKNNKIEEERYMDALQTYHAKFNRRNPQ
jgi:phage anti-repressor protein